MKWKKGMTRRRTPRHVLPRGPHDDLTAFFARRRRHVRDLLRWHHADGTPIWICDEMTTNHIWQETQIERRA